MTEREREKANVRKSQKEKKSEREREAVLHFHLIFGGGAVKFSIGENEDDFQVRIFIRIDSVR